MKKVLALVGSGEFTSEMIPVDKFLSSQIINPKVAIIPTAAGRESSFDEWIEKGVEHFKNINVESRGVNLRTRKDADDEKILQHLSNCNFYYFSGGDPGYLLDTIKDTQAWKVVLKGYLNGKVLVGSSAGAMVMGIQAWARVYDFDKYGKIIPWEKGLGVVSFGVIPHFNFILKEFSKDQVNKTRINLPKDIEIVGIDEDTAYICIDSKWKKMGKGKVYRPAFKVNE